MIHYENKLNDLFCFRRPTWIIQETSSSSFTPKLFSFLPWRPLQNSEWLTLTRSPTHPVHQGALCSCTGGGALWRGSVGSLIFSFLILLCLRPHAELKALRLRTVQRVRTFPPLTRSGADWFQRRPTNQHVDSAGWPGRLVSRFWWVSNQTRPFRVCAGVAVETLEPPGSPASCVSPPTGALTKQTNRDSTLQPSLSLLWISPGGE